MRVELARTAAAATVPVTVHGTGSNGSRPPARSLLRRSHQLAVDLGTANTVVFRRGEGIVLFEPSVVAIDERTERVHAVGTDARQMIGRTPAHIRATRPLRHGVIADFEMTEEMLRYFIRKVAGSRSRAHVIVCVPSGITEVEKNAVVEATIGAGARRAHLIDEPLAGAIGAGLPVSEAVGSLVVDVGGGTSEMAVTALGSMVVSQSLRVGGYELDEAIVRWVQENENLLIGQEQAEGLKLAVGSALETNDPTLTSDVAGRDLLTGLLRRTTVSGRQVHRALERPLRQIVDAVKDLLERTPAELSADIGDRGLTVVGGGALLRRFDELLRLETNLPVTVPESPLTAVARGAGAALEELATLERIGNGRGRRRRRLR
ncbi:MAG TPA: rod shape-determining protein [Gaiellaceae bacterium]